MANKNTKRARKLGFSSWADAQNKTNPIFKGGCCDTSRPAGKARWKGAERASQGRDADF